LPPETPPGPQATRSRSAGLTLALLGPWEALGSARGVDRDAQRRLRPACPPRPARAPFHRQGRRQQAAVVAWGRYRVRLVAAPRCAYAAVDRPGVPPRAAKRRGTGWRPGLAASGGSHRRGWDAGCPLRRAVTPVGVIPGVGLGPARTKDPPLADTCLAVRRPPHPERPRGGGPALGPSSVEQGVEGQANHTVWGQGYGAQVLCPPQRTRKPPGPQSLRRWRAGLRQRVEAVDDQRCHPCRLDRERPPERSGFQARLAATIARHHFGLWLNEQLGRPPLAFTDLVDW
jgi:hypothetical protein